MRQVLAINKIVKIFLNPLNESSLEGEAILIKRLSSVHLDQGLYWEKWLVQFIDADDEDELLTERFILGTSTNK